MKAARVLIVMPVYNEGRHLVRVLQSLAAQTFDRERMYFVAVDGNSDDETHRILESWFETSRMPGCIAVNPRRKISASLNVGLRYAADDDIVARVDAHTVYGPTYIADAVGVLERSDGDVGCVGCAYVPVPAKTFGESLVQALYTNPMGLGGADYRFGGDVREVDSAYLGVWRAQVLKRAGGFNETLDANEDADISARIRSMGYRVLRVPLPCRFIINRTPLATIRQWHKYGYWRAKMLRRHPRYIRARHAVSLVMALAALALAASPLRLSLVPIFALYAALVVRYRPAGEAPAVTLASLVYFPALQFAFAAGLVRGLLSL